MDTKHTEEPVFDSVWQRVTENSDNEYPPVINDEMILTDLIAAEKGNYSFYITANKLCGSCSPLFAALAETSRKRLGRLQTFYFLMFGNNCNTDKLTVNVPQGTLSALRSAYWRENETSSKLISAAMAISRGRFSSFGAEFARQAAENAEHIIQIIDRIMK